MENIDLNALRLLNQIFETGSLSRTAEHMGLTQPTVSIALGRLRRHFDDTLFVRIGNTMRPTPQTVGMIDSVRHAIAALESTLAYRSTFEPTRTDRTFRFAMNDIGQITLLPQLLEAIALSAPNAQIEVSNITEQTPQLLGSGDLDLALGFVPELAAGFFVQTLFKEHFACLVKASHPRIRSKLTLRQFREESHVIVTTSGTGRLIVDRALDDAKIARKVALRVPNHLGLAPIVSHTNHICTLPSRAAAVLAVTGLVSVFPVPIKLPNYAVNLHWHERHNRDPGNRWLRSLLSSLFHG